jgi:hypothetical protein
VSEVGAVGLRAAFGLGNRPEDVTRTAKDATESVRRASKAEGRRSNIPAAVRPAVIDGGTTGTVVSPAPPQVHTNNAPSTPLAHSAVWFLIHEQFVRAGRLPVTISITELANGSGLTPDEVQAAINAMLDTGQLAREPGRAGSVPRLTPVL